MITEGTIFKNYKFLSEEIKQTPLDNIYMLTKELKEHFEKYNKLECNKLILIDDGVYFDEIPGKELVCDIIYYQSLKHSYSNMYSTKHLNVNNILITCNQLKIMDDYYKGTSLDIDELKDKINYNYSDVLASETSKNSSEDRPNLDSNDNIDNFNNKLNNDLLTKNDYKYFFNIFDKDETVTKLKYRDSLYGVMNSFNSFTSFLESPYVGNNSLIIFSRALVKYSYHIDNKSYVGYNNYYYGRKYYSKSYFEGNSPYFIEEPYRSNLNEYMYNTLNRHTAHSILKSKSTALLKRQQVLDQIDKIKNLIKTYDSETILNKCITSEQDKRKQYDNLELDIKILKELVKMYQFYEYINYIQFNDLLPNLEIDFFYTNDVVKLKENKQLLIHDTLFDYEKYNSNTKMQIQFDLGTEVLIKEVDYLDYFLYTIKDKINYDLNEEKQNHTIPDKTLICLDWYNMDLFYKDGVIDFGKLGKFDYVSIVEMQDRFDDYAMYEDDPGDFEGEIVTPRNPTKLTSIIYKNIDCDKLYVYKDFKDKNKTCYVEVNNCNFIGYHGIVNVNFHNTESKSVKVYGSNDREYSYEYRHFINNNYLNLIFDNPNNCEIIINDNSKEQFTIIKSNAIYYRGSNFTLYDSTIYLIYTESISGYGHINRLPNTINCIIKGYDYGNYLGLNKINIFDFYDKKYDDFFMAIIDNPSFEDVIFHYTGNNKNIRAQIYSSLDFKIELYNLKRLNYYDSINTSNVVKLFEIIGYDYKNITDDMTPVILNRVENILLNINDSKIFRTDSNSIIRNCAINLNLYGEQDEENRVFNYKTFENNFFITNGVIYNEKISNLLIRDDHLAFNINSDRCSFNFTTYYKFKGESKIYNSGMKYNSSSDYPYIYPNHYAKMRNDNIDIFTDSNGLGVLSLEYEKAKYLVFNTLYKLPCPRIALFNDKNYNFSVTNYKVDLTNNEDVFQKTSGLCYDLVKEAKTITFYNNYEINFSKYYTGYDYNCFTESLRKKDFSIYVKDVNVFNTYNYYDERIKVFKPKET